MSEISQRVLQLIDILELKRKTFADRLGITVQTISSWIHRDTDPSFETIQAILSAYPNISARWLILGEGKPLLMNNETIVAEQPAVYRTRDKEKYNIIDLFETIDDLKVRVRALEKKLKMQSPE